MGSKIPEDKRHYSVDEMMDRLKDVQAVKDGRGRKRRRSKQPKLEPNQKFQRSLVKVTIGLAILVAIVAAVLFTLSKISEFRYGGAKFSEAVAGRLSEIYGLKIGLGKFEIDGRSISMREGRVSGGERDFLRDVQLKGFQGAFEMRSFFGSEWYFDQFEFFELSAVIDKPGADGGSTGGGAPVGGGEAAGGGFGLSSRPKALLPEVVRLRDVSLFWGAEDSGYSLQGADVVAEVFSGEMSLHANGGKLVLPGFPEWKLQNLDGKLDDGVLDIDQSRYSVGERDEVKISGTIDTKRDGGMDLKGTLENLLMSNLLPDYWQGKMEGILDAEFTFKMPFGENGEPVFAGVFDIRDYVMRGLPVFDALAVYAGEHGLGFMEVPSVKGKFTREGRVLTISEFESLKAGLLRMRGEITVTDGEIGGTLDVGLPDAVFDKLTGGRPDLFRVEDDGFAWATMNLGGTLESPTEDLSSKLTALTRERSAERANQQVPNPGAAVPKSNPSSGVVPEVGGAGAPPSDDERRKKIEDAFENLINGQ